jgi:hypothetical protein
MAYYKEKNPDTPTLVDFHLFQKVQSSKFKVKTNMDSLDLEVRRRFLNACLEKFLKWVAQAFQPVLITQAGETPALRFFIIYG